MTAAPFYEDDAVTLWHGDCLAVLRADELGYDYRLGYAPPRIPDASVDSVVTDPPYGLEFMGREWDGADGFRRSLNPADAGRDSPFGRASRTSPEYRTTGRTAGPNLFQEWCEAWAVECLRVLKPGGYVLAFGGSRTSHRLACGIEDAGFEKRDSIAWLYGSGFPKNLDVSKALDKTAGAEREVVGTKLGLPGYSLAPGRPSTVTMGTYGQGGDPAREVEVTAPATDEAVTWNGWGTALKPGHEPIIVGRKPLAGTVAANVLAYGTGALHIDACRVGTGEDRAGGGPRPQRVATGAWNMSDAGERPAGGRWPTNVVLSHGVTADGTDACAAGCLPGCPVGDLDAQTGTLTSGKAGANGHTRNAPERDEGIYGGGRGLWTGAGPAGALYGDSGGASRFYPTFRYEPKAPQHERPLVDGKGHVTVKPLGLMRWLVRLVTPAGGTVLEPFAGSGPTAEACVIEGFRCIAVEKDLASVRLVIARLSKPIQRDLFAVAVPELAPVGNGRDGEASAARRYARDGGDFSLRPGRRRPARPPAPAPDPGPDLFTAG